MGKKARGKVPVVSVIVTTRNEESNLARLLESVKRQTFKDWEVLVIDNGSTDRTKEVAKRFTSRVYDVGPERSAQRNFGVKKAEGRYVLILDADMELEEEVLGECVAKMVGFEYKSLVISEETRGDSWLAQVRRFERQMYEGDEGIELARFFNKKVFEEMGGYDESLTGPEDYDLHYRVSKRCEVGRVKARIFHHEERLTLGGLFHKKWYYANRGAKYADKHPEVVARQGTILFRKVYLRHWRKFLKQPVLGFSFLVVRTLEMMWAVTGFIQAVGWRKFWITFFRMWRCKKEN